MLIRVPALEAAPQGADHVGADRRTRPGWVSAAFWEEVDSAWVIPPRLRKSGRGWRRTLPNTSLGWTGYQQSG